MKILVTGVAGFIGFSISNFLLKRKYKIYGIDNLDNYYSIDFKKKRLEELRKYNNFYFKNFDLNNKKKLNKFLEKKNIKIIIHLAAQAGVRYSFENPKKYIDSNFFGFLNLVLCSKKHKINKIIYASSSSVYGDSKSLPVSERSELKSKNIYSASKILNENTAELYSKLFNINFVGLRFFTIFGEWGRPDMLIYKLFKSHLNRNKIKINNFGNHYRDFTYIGDVNKILYKLIKSKVSGHKIYNISSNKPINIKKLVNKFEKLYDLNKQYVKLHKADVLNTHGNNKKILNKLKVSFSKDFYKNLFNTFKWYRQNKINKIK